jgi:hypothetical protein
MADPSPQPAADIPASIDDITPEWTATATGWDVTDVEAELIGVGIGVTSAVYRLRLAGEGVPDSVVLKLPALDPAAVFTSTVLRMYIREVGFFRQLAPECPIRVPAFHGGQVDEETSSFYLLMQDMGDLRAVDQIAGMSADDAGRAVDELAAWHAQWWGRGEELASAGLVVSLGDDIYPAVLPLVFGEGWEKVTSGMPVPATIERVGGQRFSDAMAGLLRDLSSGPSTVVHGDFRADNILFADDGSLVLLDFQLIGSGSAAYDLAYFVTQSIDADVAADHERPLFERWVDGLRSRGVPDDDLGGLWDDYRKAALFCLVYPVVASRGMDLGDPRQLGLLECMNTRFVRAVDQLQLEVLLP